ncbi:MAG: hypothetical protein ACRDQZ_17995 [Mycobacteriales bacterium]
MSARKARPSMSFAAATPVTAEPPPTQTTMTAQAKPKPPAVNNGSRSAFTWRLEADRALQFDALVLRLRGQLPTRGRLDKADVLDALVALADERDDIRAALLERLQQ